MKIKKLSHEEFWPLFKPLKDKLFDDTLFYYARDVRSAYEKQQFEKLREGMRGRLEINLGLFNSQSKFVGWCSTYQKKMDELYMMNSAIMPQYRRKGCYSKMVRQVLLEAKKMGFQIVTSKHVATNNAIIIAKLKLGFKISGIDLSDEYGTLVQLTYFLNETRQSAAEFRAGQIKPTKRLKKIFKI